MSGKSWRAWAGSAIAIAAMAVALTACQTIAEPVVIGQDRYKMSFQGPDDLARASAQGFCRTKGFAFAQMDPSGGDEVEFRCSHHAAAPAPSSQAPEIECIPGLMVVDPTVCPEH